MKKKTIYRVLLGLFCLFNIFDGVAGLMREATGQEVMKQLGYPVYFLSIVGTAKLLGVIALLQTKSATLKEWAFAGFTINLICAALSWTFIGEPVGIIMPAAMLAILFLIRHLWLSVKESARTEKTFNPGVQPSLS